MRVRAPWVILACLFVVQSTISFINYSSPSPTAPSRVLENHITLADRSTTHTKITKPKPKPATTQETKPEPLPHEHPHVHDFPPVWKSSDHLGGRWTPKHEVHDKSQPPDHPYGFQDHIFELQDDFNKTVQRRPINVLWHFHPSRVVESHFLNNFLLSGIGRPVRSTVDDRRELFYNDSIVITGFETDKTKAYLTEFRKRGYVNVGVLLVAQEFHGKDSHNLAEHSDYHLRIYYFPEDVKGYGGYGEHVIWIPNGFKDGLGLHRPDRLTPASERNSTCGFAGDVKKSKPWRAKALEVIETKMGDRCHIKRMIGFGGDMGATEYGAFMESVQFSLVLDGNNPETIRLYDSLEMGMIPVLVEHPYLNAWFKGHPFLYVKNDWSNVDEVLSPYLDNPALTRELQIKVMHYWQQFVYEVRTNVTKRVDRSFREVYGEPC